MPQDEVATGIGVPLHELSRCLTGQQLPSRSMLARFARVCGADPMVLLMVREDQQRRAEV
ncbi:helix-turn-helix domain-containing protein [Streptomyces sp. NPDC091025]